LENFAHDNMLSHMSVRDDPVQRLARQIFRLDDLLKAGANEIARPAGQTGARWQVLNAVRWDPKTVADIARSKNVSRQGVQRIVNELVAEGLLIPTKNPKHSRYPLIELTKEGIATREHIERQRIIWTAEVRRHLGEDPPRAVIDFLSRFTDAIISTVPKDLK
jgi:DNA-binding MarR family transcriptional regulator